MSVEVVLVVLWVLVGSLSGDLGTLFLERQHNKYACIRRNKSVQSRKQSAALCELWPSRLRFLRSVPSEVMRFLADGLHRIAWLHKTLPPYPS